MTETVHYGDVSIKATKDFADSKFSDSSYVDFGSGLAGTISPAFGYEVTEVMIGSQKATLTDVANSDDKTFTVSNVQADTEIFVTYTAIPTVAVTYSVIDKNGTEAEGGLDGTLTASVNRKDMEPYQVKDNGSGKPVEVYQGSIVTFTAKPADGYLVEGWYSDAAGPIKIEGCFHRYSDQQGSECRDQAYTQQR